MTEVSRCGPLSDVLGAPMFSPCRTYRYWLARNIDIKPTIGLLDGWSAERIAAAVEHDSRTLAFIMLNPSTADETVNDPTIRRCIGYAKAWHYRHLLIGNLFALRSTDPKVLAKAADPVGEHNDDAIRGIAREADIVVCAWGADKMTRQRGPSVLELLRGVGCVPHFLRRTQKTGAPEHPLYLPSALTPQPWSAQ